MDWIPSRRICWCMTLDPFTKYGQSNDSSVMKHNVEPCWDGPVNWVRLTNHTLHSTLQGRHCVCWPERGHGKISRHTAHVEMNAGIVHYAAAQPLLQLNSSTEYKDSSKSYISCKRRVEKNLKYIQTYCCFKLVFYFTCYSWFLITLRLGVLKFDILSIFFAKFTYTPPSLSSVLPSYCHVFR